MIAGNFYNIQEEMMFVKGHIQTKAEDDLGGDLFPIMMSSCWGAAASRQGEAFLNGGEVFFGGPLPG